MTFANLSGVAVGYAYVVDDVAGRSGWCLLDDVVVDSGMRNRGIGHALIAEMAAWLRADGYTTIWANKRHLRDGPSGLHRAMDKIEETSMDK
ncbi:MAG: GNAT family N-acetyltransferase [Microthrixaceae bacterium]